MTRVFVDANIYVAGFLSDQGASRLVLELARRQKIALVSSRLVLREADRNLRLKSPAKVLKSFRDFLQKTRIEVVPPPSDRALRPFEPLIHPKDVPVLTAAVLSRANFLLTLDRHHFLTPQVTALKNIRIMTPGVFIKEQYLKGRV